MKKKIYAAIGLKSFYSSVEDGGRAWRAALRNGTSGGTVGSDGHLLLSGQEKGWGRIYQPYRIRKKI